MPVAETSLDSDSEDQPVLELETEPLTFDPIFFQKTAGQEDSKLQGGPFVCSCHHHNGQP